jgi:methionyl-tRNA formyltransferase|tara:strand:- start:1733 stop:2728 length:996 start_codon:yes stop_codon:yes gene_type:complete
MLRNNKFFIEKIETIIFIGWCPNIEELMKINKSFNLKSLIITSPNQQKLFNKNLKLNVFKEFNSKKIKDFISNNCNLEKTLFLSISSMFIFEKKIISFLKNNLINFFPSRLPYDQGRGGFSWHIMREDRICNQLFHLIDEDINTGPVIYNEASLFPTSCKIPVDYEDYKWKEMNRIYKNFIKEIINNKNFDIQIQNKNLKRYNPPLNTILNGYIDWSLNSYDLYNFINAFDEPHQGASTFLNTKNFGRLFIKSVQLHGGDTNNHPFMSGIVSRHDKKWITVSTSGKHMLLIEKVLNDKNKNIINEIKEGDRFITPHDIIDKSKGLNVVYKP